MTFAQIVMREKVKILRTSHASFLRGMLETWKRCTNNGTSPQEPDFVAGLVLVSTPILYHVLRSIFGPHGIHFSLAAVYCHQTPKVQFPGMSRTSCEIGDILFAHVHTPASGSVKRNALLYQAKMASSQPHRVSSSEADQLKLYSDWPLFTYFRSSPLTGQINVVPKLPHKGAQYMLIDNRPQSDPESGLQGIPGTYPIGSCMPGPYLQDHNPLADEIFDFLLLHTGRVYSDRSASSATRGWSKLIWDLLTTGLLKAFNRVNSGWTSAPRRGGGSLHLLDGTFFANTTGDRALTTARSILGSTHTDLLFTNSRNLPPYDEMPRVSGTDDGAGISLVLFETSELQTG